MEVEAMEKDSSAVVNPPLNQGNERQIDHSLFEGSSSEDESESSKRGPPAKKKRRRPLPTPLAPLCKRPDTEIQHHKPTPKKFDLWHSSSDDENTNHDSDFCSNGSDEGSVIEELKTQRNFPKSKKKAGECNSYWDNRAELLSISQGIASYENRSERPGVECSSESSTWTAGKILLKAHTVDSAEVPRKRQSLPILSDVQKNMSESAEVVLAEARARIMQPALQNIRSENKGSSVTVPQDPVGPSSLSTTASHTAEKKDSWSSPRTKKWMDAVHGKKKEERREKRGVHSFDMMTYSNIETDQFWRSIRSWDFLKALSDYVRQSEALNIEISSTASTFPSLPDTFESVEQYKALWSPLLIREAKSQTLSDISASWGNGAGQDIHYAYVKVEPISEDNLSFSHAECIIIKIREISGGKSVSRCDSPNSFVVQNETFLLVKDVSMLLNAAKGKLIDGTSSSLLDSASFSTLRWGFLGTAEKRNRGLDGLTLKVSRRLWVSLGAPEMNLVRIGSFVTALREYKALCRTDSIPLAHNILSPSERLPLKDSNVSSVSPNKFDPLSERGGGNALPPGFRIYVKANFNPSQICSISAAAREYGGGGFTLVKGPPGTGKTTTLVALLNALHLRQYQRYYSEIENITTSGKGTGTNEDLVAIRAASKVKPRILVCAPSNAAVDNIILKIIKIQFVDGIGKKYRPSIVRVGAGQSASVWKVSLQAKRDVIVSVGNNPTKLESIISDCRKQLKAYQKEIQKLQKRVRALFNATLFMLSNDYEIRIDEDTFDISGRVVYINHKTQTATYNLPGPAEPHETQLDVKTMPHYKENMDSLVRYVEKYNAETSKLEQYVLLQNTLANFTSSKKYSHEMSHLHQQLETNIIDSEHIVLTTLGSAGSKTMQVATKFEVVVVDEAAQSTEPATLVGLQLGSSHALLVGDPQQLPATIFSVSGRITKYDRSLFQRLEEAGHKVHMLDMQYRMNPAISSFPRQIFYHGSLNDGPNVLKPNYGGQLSATISAKYPYYQHFTIFDLDSTEERGGTSLSNLDEAQLVLELFCNLDKDIGGLSSEVCIAIITPYSQQVALLRQIFAQKFGKPYSTKVEISTVDAFQGREASIVIFSCVRAAHKGVGIGFLSDVKRMNVALTRAKHFLFVITRCRTIIVNPYWRDLVRHAREQRAIIKVPMKRGNKNEELSFPGLKTLAPLHDSTQPQLSRLRDGYDSEGEFSA